MLMKDAYAHVIWKLSSYGKLDAGTILHALKKHLDKTQTVRSFFEKVIETDEIAARHFVGVIASARTVAGKIEV